MNTSIRHLFLSALAITQAAACLYFIIEAAARLIRFGKIDQVALIFCVISALFVCSSWALFRAAKRFNNNPDKR